MFNVNPIQIAVKPENASRCRTLIQSQWDIGRRQNLHIRAEDANFCSRIWIKMLKPYSYFNKMNTDGNYINRATLWTQALWDQRCRSATITCFGFSKRHFGVINSGRSILSGDRAQLAWNKAPFIYDNKIMYHFMII